jgi:hypothetical protein
MLGQNPAETVLTLITFLQRHPCDFYRIWCALDAHVNQPVPSKAARSIFPIRCIVGPVKVLGATLSSEGAFSHPAVPDVILYHVHVKEFVPLLRELVRFHLLATVSLRSRKVNRFGRPQSSDFCSLEPRAAGDASLALREPFDEKEGAGLTEDQAKTLTVLLPGAQRPIDRLFRHKENLLTGLPPQSSPQCPWCWDGAW